MASSLVPAPRVVIKIKLKKKTSSLTPTHPLFSFYFLKKKKLEKDQLRLSPNQSHSLFHEVQSFIRPNQTKKFLSLPHVNSN